MDTAWPGGRAVSEVYMRWYTRYSANFLFSSISTKHAETVCNGGACMHLFSALFDYQSTNLLLAQSPNPTFQTNSYQMQPGQERGDSRRDMALLRDAHQAQLCRSEEWCP